ncbi:MAG: hypothetical protein UT03_C0064G0002 [Candidatus Moranbacteria bacterium GW2011_GWD2_38_7]|nr:MAG: hypothetical protein UT03_C0064G0002 [Candidatus Moranbacteria bacterium GW2011_GWD2_38_7]
MLKEPIQIGSFQNGLGSLGKLQQNKFVTLDNCDIHSETGICQPQLAMESESTTPNEACLEAIDNTGNIFAVSTTSGKIWKRTTAASWSLIHTNANGAHRGARYFNGFLWYWTATKLGTYDLASTYNDSFATGSDFREGIEANNTLLIANGRYTSRVDSTNTFSANEFVVPAQYKQTCLKNVGDDVLVGTYVSNDVAYCKAFLWDTVSTAWSYEAEVFEIGINCFVTLGEIILAQCGTQGRFYYWTGSKLKRFGKIRGITTALGEQKSVVYNGRALFANGTKIYSIHSEEEGLSIAFCGEYTCTGTINSLIVQGQTLLASVGTGFDKRGNNYATATIETAESKI